MPDEEAFKRQWDADLERETRRIEAEVEIQAQRISAQMAAQIEAINDDYRNPATEEPPRRTWLTRADYVSVDDEARHLTRDEDGQPTIRLVWVDDRLSVWSPLDGGAFINPRGPGLRRFGLYASQVRGKDFQGRMTAFRAADLRAGRWVRLEREPANEHDKNAVAMYAVDGSQMIGYVQRGRASAVARAIDKGQQWAAVSLHGPGPGSTFDSCRLLLGRGSDLRRLLEVD